MDLELVKMKVCMVGEAAVGKTSLVRRFVLDLFNEAYAATLGARVTKRELHFKGLEIDKHVRVDMTLWDIMGERFVRDELRESYLLLVLHEREDRHGRRGRLHGGCEAGPRGSARLSSGAAPEGRSAEPRGGRLRARGYGRLTASRIRNSGIRSYSFRKSRGRSSIASLEGTGSSSPRTTKPARASTSK